MSSASPPSSQTQRRRIGSAIQRASFGRLLGHQVTAHRPRTRRFQVVLCRAIVGELERFVAVISLRGRYRSEEHTSELQSRLHLVCRLLLEKKKTTVVSERSRQTTMIIIPRTFPLQPP